MTTFREGQSWRCKDCGGYAILTCVDEPALGRGGPDATDARARIVAMCLDCDDVPTGQLRAYRPFPARPRRTRRRLTI